MRLPNDNSEIQKKNEAMQSKYWGKIIFISEFYTQNIKISNKLKVNKNTQRLTKFNK